MALRTDLTALLADAGIIDVDVGDAVADEHVRWSVYQRIASVAAASRERGGDRAIVAAMLRDPVEMVAKSAVVDLVDKVAVKATDPTEFRRWSAEVLLETDRFEAEGNREFVRRRIRDWLCYLSVKDGQVPAELAEVSNWMQRVLAETSTSLPVLTLLAESGRTRKIRNIAKNRAGSRELIGEDAVRRRIRPN
jgi:hypothetical protein